MTAPFSIVVTCHNQVSYIQQAVESALAQPHGKEIIVVDDASTDGSPAILRQYRGRIKLIACETNQGASRARNLGASVATGDYLVFLDGDDVLLLWALEVYAAIVQAKRPKLILGKLLWCEQEIPAVDRNEMVHEIAVWDYESLVAKDRPYRGCASAMVVERSTFAEVGGWRNDLFPGEVDDLLAKLACSGRTIQICSPPTTAYRVHTANTVHQVPKFVQIMHTLLRNERAGDYRGGREHRFARRAFIGGPVFYWAQASLRSRCYRPALKLLASGWPMILAAIMRRIYARFKGRRPVEVIG